MMGIDMPSLLPPNSNYGFLEDIGYIVNRLSILSLNVAFAFAMPSFSVGLKTCTPQPISGSDCILRFNSYPHTL